MAEPDDPGGCNAILVADYSKLTWSANDTAAYLDTIGSATYKNLQDDFNSGVSIPIEGLPFGFTGTYDEFRTKLEQYFDQIGYESNYNASLAIVNSKVSADVAQKWLSCKQTFAAQTGLTSEIVAANGATVVVKVTWAPAPGLDNAVVTSSFLSGAKAAGQAAGVAVPAGTIIAPGSQQFSFTRSARMPFVMNMNVQVRTGGVPAGTYTTGVSAPRADLHLLRATGSGTNPRLLLQLDNATYRVGPQYPVETGFALDFAVVRIFRFLDAAQIFELYFDAGGNAERQVPVDLQIACLHGTVTGKISVVNSGHVDIEIDGRRMGSYASITNQPFTWKLL